MPSLNLHVGGKADGKVGKQKGKRTLALHCISDLLLVMGAYFHGSGNTNATEIYKPIRGSYFVLSRIVESLECLEC